MLGLKSRTWHETRQGAGQHEQDEKCAHIAHEHAATHCKLIHRVSLASVYSLAVLAHQGLSVDFGFFNQATK